MIDFEGIDELLREIDQVERDAEQLKDKALVEGGEYLKNEIASQVYAHGLTRRTGQAEDSITRTEPKSHALFVGTKGGANAPGFYLYMHEFGYFNVRAGRFIAPKPLVSVVYENNKATILDKYVDVFQRGLGMR
ncbi:MULTISPECIES: hypothetical protein [unclassified Oceanobacillus]|uniref:hypothetical protein n=1 Tax=unclassified Oceanobacillus TaxID=2630292 RepID=UPI001BEB109B|nr:MULTISPECIES: hypothetical protein [unclassified Oceanobacillus]MBT2600946.1 hypothetical protein [Oceanobacillus sp. ISL-74]MBT2653603.1 hypothetical protein [Oceanobacillus sp. ISL-73]